MSIYFVWNFHLWHCYEHFRTKNVVHLTFFRKILIKTQCIDCGNDYFCCQFRQNMKFSKCLSRCIEYFIYGTVMNIVGPKDVVHLTFFRKIVIETQFKDSGKDNFWCQCNKIWNFLNVSHFVWIFIALLWTF